MSVAEALERTPQLFRFGAVRFPGLVKGALSLGHEFIICLKGAVCASSLECRGTGAPSCERAPSIGHLVGCRCSSLGFSRAGTALGG